MRYFGEYILAFVAMIATVFFFVKPETKSHWSPAVRFGFYLMALSLFLGVIMFEYFSGKHVSDLVRDAIGDAFCRIYTIDSCPSSRRAELERQNAERQRVDAKKYADEESKRKFQQATTPAQPLPAGLDPNDTIFIDTIYGRIVMRLRPDIAPKHAGRIKQLARDKFYDNVPFHRVMEGFMAQTGDGQYFNGTGGSKYPNLQAEFSNVPFRRGIVGMARKGGDNNSANSQFFIMYATNLALNGQYTVVGEVVSGMNVVDKLNKGEPVANPDKMLHVQVAADVI
jgi:peptidylprolyl isomerase